MLDIIMAVLFVLFMIFVFGGYHKNKAAEREAQYELEEKALKEKKLKKES